MTKRLLTTLLGVTLLGVGIDRPAYASAFDFNSLLVNGTAANVQTYMNGLLGSGQSVVVTSDASQIVTNSYNGENHVVGPNGVSVTLGTTDAGVPHGGANDNFLYTFGGTYIQMLFSGLTVSGVTFDYEIFPDNTCSSGTGNCPNGFPDFTLQTRVGANPWVNAFADYAAFPASPNNESPLTFGNSQIETSAQLGPKTLSLTLGPGVTGLRFVDWPPTIGIDNLCINCTPAAHMPEPASLTLCATGLLVVVSRRFRNRKKK